MSDIARAITKVRIFIVLNVFNYYYFNYIKTAKIRKKMKPRSKMHVFSSKKLLTVKETGHLLQGVPGSAVECRGVQDKWVN